MRKGNNFKISEAVDVILPYPWGSDHSVCDKWRGSAEKDAFLETMTFSPVLTFCKTLREEQTHTHCIPDECIDINYFMDLHNTLKRLVRNKLLLSCLSPDPSCSHHPNNFCSPSTKWRVGRLSFLDFVQVPGMAPPVICAARHSSPLLSEHPLLRGR